MTRAPVALAALVVPALLILAACAGPADHDRVVATRAAIQSARSDPAIARYAPVPLNEAEQAMAQAETASQAGNKRETDHYLTLAESRLDTARSRAQAEVAQAERQGLAQQSAEQRAARLENELEALRAKQTPQGTVFTLTDVLFETGKAQLKPGAYNRLMPLASYLKAHPEANAIIQGFTDNTGSSQRNLDLSQRRAESVREFLVAEGIEPGRVSAKGMGQDYPIATNDTNAGRQQNRRVEVLVSEAPR